MESKSSVKMLPRERGGDTRAMNSAGDMSRSEVQKSRGGGGGGSDGDWLKEAEDLLARGSDGPRK